MATANDPCSITDIEGYTYRDFTCMVPSIKQMYFSFEKDFDCSKPLRWMQNNHWFPIAAVSVYAVFVYFGPKLMKNRESWNWRAALALWSLGLSVFSFFGVSRVVPHALYGLQQDSLHHNFCSDPRNSIGGASTGLWIWLFAMSKFPELLDTFFIVIHKKPLIFLHWYHHITVLLYTWMGYTSETRIGMFMAAMNYTVHAVMYAYYFLMACRIRPKWFNPKIITYMQIAQMFVGCAIAITAYYFKKMDPDCKITENVISAGFLMYGSYLILFVKFFLGRYLHTDVKINKQKTV